MSTYTPTTQQRMDHLTALPSVSRQLSSLPQAKSLDAVALHHPTLASHLPAQEAKLRKALSVTSQNSANGHQQQHLMPSKSTSAQNSSCSHPPLMMRPTKSKLR